MNKEPKCIRCGYLTVPGEIIDYDSIDSNYGECPKCGKKGIPLWIDNPNPVRAADLLGDPINSPSHYFFGEYQVRDVLQAWLKVCGLPNDEASDWEKMMEYLFRYHKKGSPKLDLGKARFYLEKIEERYDGTN